MPDRLREPKTCHMSDPSDYASKKAFFNRMLTLYGRKPVLETLRDDSLQCHALHLAQSNRSGGIVESITREAQRRQIPINHHSRDALSRISKNGRQDQGVALDVICPGFRSLDDYLADTQRPATQRLLALDGISNPQNLGMLIRSSAAGAIDGIVLPSKGNAALGPLVIKASAGTLYRAPVLSCERLVPALQALKSAGANICTLEGGAAQSLFSFDEPDFVVYVMGNETEGVSPEAGKLAQHRLAIPMNNGVESLNVAVAASLIAFGPYFDR